jgi:parallel beta helix pectate lyase-like protein
LESTTYEAYTIANTAKIAPLTNFYENIIFEGITITSAKTTMGAGLTGGQNEFRFIRNLQFIDVEFDNLYWSGCQLWNVWDASFIRCKFKKVSVVTGSTPAYGCSIRGASINIKIEECEGDGNRHSVTQGAGAESPVNGSGRTRNIVIDGNTFRNTTESHIDCHAGALGFTVSNNTCVSDDTNANAIQTRSPANIVGNTIQGVHGKGIYAYGADATNSRISDNWIFGCTYGIFADLGAHKLQINDNKIYGCSIDGIFFNGIATDHAGDYSIIQGNQINDNASDGIEIDSAIGVDIDGNQIRGNAGSIRLLNTDGTLASNVIHNNHIINNTANDPVGTTLGTGNRVRNNMGITIDQDIRQYLVAQFSMLRDENAATTYTTAWTVRTTFSGYLSGAEVADAFQESQSIETKGFTQVKASWYHRRGGTGTQSVRIIESGTANVLLEQTAITADGKRTFAFANIPAALVNRVFDMEVQVLSTVTTDDIFISNLCVYLK